MMENRIRWLLNGMFISMEEAILARFGACKDGLAIQPLMELWAEKIAPLASNSNGAVLADGDIYNDM
jgi:hypothetical protein